MTATHRATWTLRGADQLVFRADRPSAASTSRASARSRKRDRDGWTPSSRYEGVEKRVNGRLVTLVRERRTGRTWRLSPDGSWVRTNDDADHPAKASRPTVRLVFDGPVSWPTLTMTTLLSVCFAKT